MMTRRMTGVSTTNPEKWEIWLTRVVYEDNPQQFKLRPVVVLENNIAVILSLKMTSKPPRQNYRGEYELQLWKQAGLTKQTTVRCSKLIRSAPTDYLRKLGRLQAMDILNIQNILDDLY